MKHPELLVIDNIVGIDDSCSCPMLLPASDVTTYNKLPDCFIAWLKCTSYNALIYNKRSTLYNAKVLVPITPIYALLLSLINPRFQSVLLYEKPFSSYRTFCDKCTPWAQNVNERYTVIAAPYICYKCFLVPNFTPFCSIISTFELDTNFKATELNSSKIISNNLRWNVTHKRM